MRDITLKIPHEIIQEIAAQKLNRLLYSDELEKVTEYIYDLNTPFITPQIIENAVYQKVILPNEKTSKLNQFIEQLEEKYKVIFDWEKNIAPMRMLQHFTVRNGEKEVFLLINPTSKDNFYVYISPDGHGLNENIETIDKLLK